MSMIPQGAFVDPRPFGLPADSIEIMLDLPFPPSTNRLHKHFRSHVYRTKEYEVWIKACDVFFLKMRSDRRVAGLDPLPQITGPFEIEIWLEDLHAGDGDNRIKAVLDWLQHAGIIENDRDCRRGYWAWKSLGDAPAGCRVILRSLHGENHNASRSRTLDGTTRR